MTVNRRAIISVVIGLGWLVRPELVVEIAFNDVQESSHYPGGLALRLARVKRYRVDKSPADADTIETVRDIYRQSAATPLDSPGRSL